MKIMKRLNYVIASLAVLLPLAYIEVASAAATPINQSRPLNANGSVEIDNVRGLIKVRVWNEPKVQISGLLGEGVEKLLVDGDANRLRIKVKYPQRNGWSWGDSKLGDTRLEVMVPIRANLEIEAVSANVDTQGSAASTMDINSVSGDVQVLASSPGKLSVDTVSGNVLLKLTSNEVNVNTVSGDLNLLGHLKGRVELETVSGNAKLDTPFLSQLKFNSVSGDGTFKTKLLPEGKIEMETVSGGLTLNLSKETSAKVEIESFSGDISSAVGKVEEEEYGSSSSLHAKIGDGKGQINLNSMSGDINLNLDK
jgi:DUF4097 and DUF4098 domain-containing protein YvlB